ncbi:MAG: hypothetical protein PF689_06190 [Deltaproteobacteria bacterium]|jgi:hypothetical protein|nr:hypothetical protein [Deltaproteobacteria bacterium]
MHKFFFAIFITYFSCFIQTAQGVDRKSEGSKLKVKTDAKVKTDTKDEESEVAPFQIGIFTDFHYLPEFSQRLFMKASPAFSMYSTGINFTWFKTSKIKFIFSAGVLLPDIKQGNYLGINENFNEMHYLEFSNLKMTFIGWEIYWQNKISSDIYWFAGGGVRLGYLSGSMKSTNAQGCNQDNWREPSSGVNYAGGCWHDNFKEFYSDVDYPWGFGFLNIGGGLVYQFSQKLGVVVSTYLEFPGFLRVNLALDYVLPF